MRTNKKHQHRKQCIAMFEKLSEYIDNELDDVTCKDIEKHAKECIQCHTCLETLKRTIEICKGMEKKPVPALFSHRLKEIVKELS